MKKIKISAVFLMLVFAARSQQSQNPTTAVPRSGLQTSGDGLPLDIAVLRYNGNVLAVQPYEVSVTYVFYGQKNADLKTLKNHAFTLYFPKDSVKPGEVIELVSAYGFTLKDGILTKTIGQQAIEWKQQKLPSYLSFSVEEIKLH